MEDTKSEKKGKGLTGSRSSNTVGKGGVQLREERIEDLNAAQRMQSSANRRGANGAHFGLHHSVG